MAAMIAEFVASFRYKASRTPIPLCQTMVGLLWPSRAERPFLAPHVLGLLLLLILLVVCDGVGGGWRCWGSQWLCP